MGRRMYGAWYASLKIGVAARMMVVASFIPPLGAQSQGKPPIPDYRKDFAMQLSQKAEGTTFSVSGEDHRTLDAEAMSGSGVVALLSNQLGAIFWQKGFERLHVSLPDGNGGADQWMVEINPWGYSQVRSTQECGIKNSSAKDAKLCLDTKVTAATPSLPPANPSAGVNSPQARQTASVALTISAAKQGRHTVFVVCGKDGSTDSICVTDADTPEDGYVTQIGTNTKLAESMYGAGFRHLMMSNGRGGFWACDIMPDKFVPMHAGVTFRTPDAAQNRLRLASWQQPSDDAGAMLGQQQAKALDPGALLLTKEAQKRALTKEDAIIRRGPSPATTVFRNIYIGEPIRGVNLRDQDCYTNTKDAIFALLKYHHRHPCLLNSIDGHTVGSIVVFDRAPVQSVTNELMSRYGRPLSSPYRFSQESPEGIAWLNKDGTLIGINVDSMLDMTGAAIVYTQIVVTRAAAE